MYSMEPDNVKLLCSYILGRSLRSISRNLVVVSSSNTKKFGERALQVAAPFVHQFR